MVSPDAGGVERARAYAKRLNATLAIIDKRRERANVSEVMNIIGDVKGRDCVLLDDMIDTAGTLTNAARALADRGARRVYAAATHAVLSRAPRSPHRRLAADRGDHHRHRSRCASEARGTTRSSAWLGVAAPGRGDPPHPQQRLDLSSLFV
jgi:hypothetical protein